MHRDIKMENVLLDEFLNAKLADFGFARKLEADETSKTCCGSPAYASPEILAGIPYTFTSDIWSLGVVSISFFSGTLPCSLAFTLKLLYVIVCASMPYNDVNLAKMLLAQQRRLQFPSTVQLTLELRSLLQSILEPEMKFRYTLDRVMSSMWLSRTPHLMHGPDDDTIIAKAINESAASRVLPARMLAKSMAPPCKAIAPRMSRACMCLAVKTSAEDKDEESASESDEDGEVD